MRFWANFSDNTLFAQTCVVDKMKKCIFIKCLSPSLGTNQTIKTTKNKRYCVYAVFVGSIDLWGYFSVLFFLFFCGSHPLQAIARTKRHFDYKAKKENKKVGKATFIFFPKGRNKKRKEWKEEKREKNGPPRNIKVATSSLRSTSLLVFSFFSLATPLFNATVTLFSSFFLLFSLQQHL